MEATAEEACAIARLPEELVSAALSLTTPGDACRATTVSPAFRAAADSDAVWSCFVPRDLPPLADGELPPPSSLPKKELFLRLSDSNRPVLLSDRLTSMWLDRETGAKCFMLSARMLFIAWDDTPQYWCWIPLTDSRFSEGAELLAVCWLEIRGKIHSKMLSPNSTYTAYMVFKLADDFYGLDFPKQEASVSVGETKSTRQALLGRCRRRKRRAREENILIPQKRTDGWMELELGEFFNEGGEDGDVSISLTETKAGNWKKGLIVQGVEIRLKKSG